MIISHTELGAMLPKRVFLSYYSKAKMNSNSFGFEHKEAFWTALYARHTILFKPGVCAGISEIAFIYQPSRHDAYSAKLWGRFKGTGRTYGKTPPPSFYLPN